MCYCALHVRRNHRLSKYILTLCRRRFLTQFFYRGGGRLTGARDGLSALHSVCPAGACMGEPGCSQCRWRTTEYDTHTHIMHENKQMCTCTVKPLLTAGRTFNVIMPSHLISEQLLRCCLSRTLQWSEDTAYLTTQHSPLRDSMGLYWTTGLRHDQYPFPAASDYRAVHILNRCFSSL